MDGINPGSTTHTHQPTPLTNSISTIERDHFLSELTTWKNKVHGENREYCAEQILEAYDRTIANPSAEVILNLSYQRITEVPPLPAGLTGLYLSHTDVTALPENWPAGLTYLDLSGTQVSALPGNWPAGLTRLDLSHTQVSAWPENLPAGLTYLFLSGTQVSAWPENWPAGLTELFLSRTQVTALPENLPAGLTYLDLSRTQVTALPENLPAGLTDLDLSRTQVTALPENLPAGLTYLDLSRTQVSALPGNWPAGLTYLVLSGTQVSALPENLPDGLTYLDLSGTPVSALPENLPAGLTYLGLSGTQVTALPENLPAGLNRQRLLQQVRDNINRTQVRVMPDNLLNVLWDNHVVDRIQTAASNNQALYSVQGGIKEVFASQAPNGEQIDEITSWISTHLDALKSGDGMRVGESSLTLPEGADRYTFEDFDVSEEPGKNTEWCLLRQGGNIFNFITAATATRLIEGGSTHPISRQPLTAPDFIRGQALLILLGIAHTGGEGRSSGAGTGTGSCAIF